MPTITEFKGNSLLNLNPDDKFIFSFGLSKAKMILANIDAIKIFVDTDGQSCEKEKGIQDLIQDGDITQNRLSGTAGVDLLPF